jgi:glucokinase
VIGPTALGIDIGGTKIAGALVNREGLAGPLLVVPTQAHAGGPSVLDRAVILARSIADSAPHDVRPVAAGIAAGGWIDSLGRVVGATNLLPDWAGIDLRGSFASYLDIPVVAMNDVHAMGIAEARIGAGRGRCICLAVAVGTGIGGAITLGGRLHRGAHGIAGALGHLPVGRGGPICSCGRHGCIEAYASGPAIARAYDALMVQEGRWGSSSGVSTLPDVLRAIESAVERVRAPAEVAVTVAGRRLGRVIGGLANSFDPDVVIVGGGAAAALGERFLGAIRSGVSEVILNPAAALPIVPSLVGPSASVVGAGLLALEAARARAC